MKAVVGATASVLTLLVITAVAAAVAHFPRRSHAHAATTAAWSAPVGPDGYVSERPAPTPASSGGASQLVSGVAQSTNAVRFTSLDRPMYYGTEPALMTYQRRGAELVVTVAPR